MSKEELEEYESPYCEVCGTCGYIDCCGIRNFIDKHIKGKTDCKNEDDIIVDLINLCEYRDKVFEERNKYKSALDKLLKLKRYTSLMEYDEEFVKVKDIEKLLEEIE